MWQRERQDTIVCTFDKTSPRISAFDIHEWIYTKLKLESEDVNTLQVDGPRRQVFIKVNKTSLVDDILHITQGESSYQHDTGEISKVTISQAGLGKRIVRVANLPPELKNEDIRQYMKKYGTILTIQEEKWSRNYRYNVSNGVRLIHMELTAHVPSHIHITGHRALVTYMGQPTTCYICNDTAHVANECPTRQNQRREGRKTYTNTWANIVELGHSTTIHNDTNQTTIEEKQATNKQQQSILAETILNKEPIDAQSPQQENKKVHKEQSTKDINTQPDKEDDNSGEAMETTEHIEEPITTDYRYETCTTRTERKERKGKTNLPTEPQK